MGGRNLREGGVRVVRNPIDGLEVAAAVVNRMRTYRSAEPFPMDNWVVRNPYDPAVDQDGPCFEYGRPPFGDDDLAPVDHAVFGVGEGVEIYGIRFGELGVSGTPCVGDQ